MSPLLYRGLISHSAAALKCNDWAPDSAVNKAACVWYQTVRAQQKELRANRSQPALNNIGCTHVSLQNQT